MRTPHKSFLQRSSSSVALIRSNSDPIRIAISLVALTVLMAGCRRESPERAQATPTSMPVATSQETPKGRWVEVARKNIRRTTPAVGSFRARRTALLGPQVTGRVQEMLSDVGDRIKQDQVLVRLDPVMYEIEVQQNRAAVAASQGALASAEADVEYSKRELARLTSLFERQAGSQKEFDDADTALQRAVAIRDERKGRLAEAEQHLASAQQRLKETVIRAPFDGVVTQRLVEPGTIASSFPVTIVMEVREDTLLFLEFSLPQDLLSSVHAGTQIQFEAEGLTEDVGKHSAQIEMVFPELDVATRSFRCRAAIENQNLLFRPGLLARVEVVNRERADALVVPRAALLRRVDNASSIVVENDGQPVKREVQLGLVTDDEAEIVAGLDGIRRVLIPNGN